MRMEYCSSCKKLVATRETRTQQKEKRGQNVVTVTMTAIHCSECNMFIRSDSWTRLIPKPKAPPPPAAKKK